MFFQRYIQVPSVEKLRQSNAMKAYAWSVVIGSAVLGRYLAVGLGLLLVLLWMAVSAGWLAVAVLLGIVLYGGKDESTEEILPTTIYTVGVGISGVLGPVIVGALWFFGRLPATFGTPGAEGQFDGLNDFCIHSFFASALVMSVLLVGWLAYVTIDFLLGWVRQRAGRSLVVSNTASVPPVKDSPVPRELDPYVHELHRTIRRIDADKLPNHYRYAILSALQRHQSRSLMIGWQCDLQEWAAPSGDIKPHLLEEIELWAKQDPRYLWSLVAGFLEGGEDNAWGMAYG